MALLRSDFQGVGWGGFESKEDLLEGMERYGKRDRSHCDASSREGFLQVWGTPNFVVLLEMTENG